MNRLRSFAHDYLLPLVISALVLRALIPVGFMPGGHAGQSLTAALCNVPGVGVPATEIIQIPGAPFPGENAPSNAGVHCDFCLQPVLGAVYAAAAIAPAAAIETLPLHGREDAPASRFALDRAQIPRAPPLA